MKFIDKPGYSTNIWGNLFMSYHSLFRNPENFKFTLLPKTCQQVCPLKD